MDDKGNGDQFKLVDLSLSYDCWSMNFMYKVIKSIPKSLGHLSIEIVVDESISCCFLFAMMVAELEK